MVAVAAALYAVMVVTLGALSVTIEGRVPNIPRQRMEWATHLGSLTRREFKRRYRLSGRAFATLSQKIEPLLARKPRGQNPISTDLRLSMALRYLSGGSYVDICDMHGVSYQAFYPCLWETCEAICDSSYKFRWFSTAARGSSTTRWPSGSPYWLAHSTAADFLTATFSSPTTPTLPPTTSARRGRTRTFRPVSSPSGAVIRALFDIFTCPGDSASEVNSDSESGALVSARAGSAVADCLGLLVRAIAHTLLKVRKCPRKFWVNFG